MRDCIKLLFQILYHASSNKVHMHYKTAQVEGAAVMPHRHALAESNALVAYHCLQSFVLTCTERQRETQTNKQGKTCTVLRFKLIYATV